MKLSIVIPARNEQAVVEKIINLLLQNFNKDILEIIIVNDCSIDNTKKILNLLSQKNSKIKPIHRKGENGVGNALREGIRNVSTKADYVLMIDCDFVENIKNIKNILQKASTADVLYGSRFLKKGSLKNYPFLKKAANRSFHFILKHFFRIPYKDVSNNFKLFRKEALDATYPLLRSSGFSINAEIGIYPHLLQLKLKEVPVVWIGRTQEMGSSNFNVVKAGPGYLRVLLDILSFKYKSGNHAPKHSHIEEQKHFDELIKKTGETYYGNLRPIAKIRFSRKADSIIKMIGDLKNPKVLDFGCGTGILSEYILKKRPALNIKGIDISPKAIQVARKKNRRYKYAHFQTGNVTSLPFKNNSFDAVIGNSILHHIPLEESLKEIRRVLKPKGKIWFCEPNMLNPQIAVEKNIPFIKSFFQDSEDERAFSKWGIKRDLEKHGFSHVIVEPYEFLHPLIPKMSMNLIAKFCIMLEKIPIIKEFGGTMQITGLNNKSIALVK